MSAPAARRRREPLRRPAGAPARGFTILELLVSLSMFAILGIAIVSLLGQGLSLFSSGTADTTMQDRIQASFPAIRDELLQMQPPEPPEVIPPPLPDDAEVPPVDPRAAAEGPAARLIAGSFTVRDTGVEKGYDASYVGFVRTNGREAEDPLLRSSGTVGAATGVPLRHYDPAAAESGVTGNLLATGGLLEVVYVAIPDDPDLPGMLTLYRLFRAPAGGSGSLLNLVGGVPVAFDSVSKIRAAGRPVLEGVLHFGVTFRNLFATSWTDGAGAGKVFDGGAYVGTVWDSTRALHAKFPLHRGIDSLADVRDDVFPAMARLELVLAVEGPYGFNRGETLTTGAASADEKRIPIGDVEPLFRPGPPERYVKIGTEWMLVSVEATDLVERRITVVRGRRGTKAVEHKADEPVWFGRYVQTDVALTWKDRHVRR